MMDREKVIKGLECHKRAMYGSIDEHGHACNLCPYRDMDNSCRPRTEGKLISDALALLKAQEPIEARLNLCESCTKEYAECKADKTDLVYGSGVGNDNIIGCSWYVNRWKAQEPRVMTLEEVKSAWRNRDIAFLVEYNDGGNPVWMLYYGYLSTL